MVANLIKNVIYRGHSPYYYARKFLFNAAHWNEWQRRRRFMPASDSSKLAALEKDGWCGIEVDPASVADVVSYCQRVDAAMDPNSEPPNAGAGKDFWRLLIDTDTIDQHPEVIRFASQDALKNLASAYLGEEAVLANITLMKSYPTTRRIKHSQLWHLDGGDSRLLLFYVYCSDVDGGAGPFSVVSKSDMKPMWRPRYMRKYGFTDSEIVALSRPDAVQEITGAAGTVFACDTARTYHQGSRCERSTRLALGIRYTTFSGLSPVQEIRLPASA